MIKSRLSMRSKGVLRVKTSISKGRPQGHKHVVLAVNYSYHCQTYVAVLRGES